MHQITLFMLVVVTTFEFLTKGDSWGRWAVLPPAAAYLPELLGLAALIYVVIAGTRSRFQYVRPAYWFIFGALLITVLCGILVNAVASGPIFAGIRTYLRSIAWFFVPAVYAFTDRQVETQLRLLLAVALLQIPFAVQQRIATAWAVTGDWTIGTLMSSGTLSIFMVCCICIAVALLIRRKLRWQYFLVLSLLLLVPTMLNETKVTIVLLPLGLVIAVLAASKPGRRLQVMLLSGAILVFLSAIFVPVYDYMKKDRPYAVPITEFMTSPERIERYLWKKQELGTTAEVGRVDAAVVSVRLLVQEPSRAVFGYGIGNASDSALGHSFSGRYNRLFGPFVSTSFARMVLELGLLGLGLVLAVMWLIYRDARAVANSRDNFIGALAAGWAGVTVVIGIAILYNDVIRQTSLSYLYWYFSGLVAAERMRRSLVQVPMRVI